MQSLDNGETSRWWRAMIWSLRIGVALQCLGNWWWLTRIGESPLLGWLINPADIGGLQWNESTAIATQRAIGWLALVAGVVVLLRPCAAVLGPLVLLQVTIATAMWRSADGFSLTADWLPAQWVTLFPFMTQAARIAAPAGLLLLDPWRPARPLREKRTRSAVTLLRWAAAVTFLAHGIESWQHNPQFTDLLIGATARVFGAELSQSTAEKLLSIIGAADMLVAIACVVVAVTRREVETAGDLFVEQNVLHRFEDVRVETNRELAYVSSTFVGVEDFLEFLVVGAVCGRFDDPAFFESQSNALKAHSVVDGRRVVMNDTFYRIPHRRGEDFAVRNVLVTTACVNWDVGDTEAKIGVSWANNVNFVGC